MLYWKIQHVLHGCDGKTAHDDDHSNNNNYYYDDDDDDDESSSDTLNPNNVQTSSPFNSK